jgi:SAM-dependent methyltransferase
MDVWPRVRDELGANRAYAGPVADAYDVWMPHDAPYHDDDYFRTAIEAGDGPALELACGTGRLLVRYAKAGLDVEGVDSAPDMLAVCKRNAAREGATVTLHEADITTLALDRRYATIYNPAGSFALHDDRDVAVGALGRWAGHLAPDGRLYVTIGIPRDDLDAEYEWRIRRSATRPYDGRTFMVHEAVRCDVAAQTQTIYNRLEIYDASGVLEQTWMRRARLRWWERSELEEAFAACGLVDVRSDGGDDAFITVGRSAT